MAKLFQIYRSSAGSGKTRTLAKEYLKLALRFRSDYFKHILAVTFTNKSTQEMKDRIMRYLNEFSQGETNELAAELQQELGLDPQTFQGQAREVQAAILHNYNQFAISTIDAFFQKVIRSFTREAGILGDYRLEIEQDMVMEEVIGNLIDELGERPELAQWVVELALQNLENDRSWDMRNSLTSFSNEIFRDEFKEVEGNINLAAQNESYFRNTLEALQKKKFGFVNFVKSRAKEVMTEFQALGLQMDDFKYRSNGSAYGWFLKVSEFRSVKDFDEKARGSRVENEFQSSRNWSDKGPRSEEINGWAEKKWINQLNEILDFRKKNYQVALSAEIALSNFYAFGLLTDISRKLSEYKRENNLMLLADAPQFLHGIIQNSDTPFIYEKAGSFYRNFLIDEFQDTSGLQWKNFQPLLTNGLDSGYPSLIVGDVKQAIYRWRGGDQSLLQNAIENELGAARTDVTLLNKNFRSAGEIIAFNNALFKSVATIASLNDGLAIAGNEYHDVAQLAAKPGHGFVHVQFFADEGDLKWKDEAMRQTVLHIEELQKLGARPSEIALLVRTNVEGQELVSYLLEHKSSGAANPRYQYDVVSSESLRIDSASAVNLLTAALAYLLNPEDAIARAQLAYEHSRQQGSAKSLADVFAVSNTVIFENNLPPAFTERKISLRRLSLFELTETLIEIFALGTPGELPYLLAFQDLVLDFANRERNDLRAFLDWWEDNKEKKSIVAPMGAEAMQLFTLHKAKGLQFRYVIVPFCSWGLDHDGFKSPNLWVKSSTSVFNGIGYLPMKYSSSLKESLFAEAYEAERLKIYLDNLNLLYVALTRAENGLIVFAPDPKVRNQKNSVARLLYDGIKTSQELVKDWNTTLQRWRSGEVSGSPESGIAKTNTTSLENYSTSPWRSKLIIKKTAPRLTAQEDDEQRQKINYGIYLHAAFSKITYAGDISLAVSSMVSEGKINEDEKKLLEKSIHTLMENPLVADWFSPNWEVRNETHALLPGGKEYRIDRLLLKDKRAVVIDYKTGSPKKEDQKQIGEYCLMLNQMGYSSEGYLLYLAEREVMNVVPPKVAKKKNPTDGHRNQLGLDF